MLEVKIPRLSLINELITYSVVPSIALQHFLVVAHANLSPRVHLDLQVLFLEVPLAEYQQSNVHLLTAICKNQHVFVYILFSNMEH